MITRPLADSRARRRGRRPPYRRCTPFAFRRRNAQGLAEAPSIRFLALRPAALILSFLAGEDFLNKEWRQGEGRFLAINSTH